MTSGKITFHHSPHSNPDRFFHRHFLPWLRARPSPSLPSLRSYEIDSLLTIKNLSLVKKILDGGIRENEKGRRQKSDELFWQLFLGTEKRMGDTVRTVAVVISSPLVPSFFAGVHLQRSLRTHRTRIGAQKKETIMFPLFAPTLVAPNELLPLPSPFLSTPKVSPPSPHQGAYPNSIGKSLYTPPPQSSPLLISQSAQTCHTH